MDTNMIALANSINKAIQSQANQPPSMSITKIPEIQSRTVRQQTFLEFLETVSKRTRDITTNNVTFYEEADGSDAEFIAETDEIPEYTAKNLTEVTDSTKTIAIPINVGLKTQEGSQEINLKDNLIQDGYVKVNNLIDKTLLQGNATENPLEFNKIWNGVESIDNNGDALTETTLKDTIRTCIDNGGTPDCLVTDAFVANQIDEWVSPFIRYNNVVEIAAGHTVSTFKSTDGSFIPILVDKNMPSDTDDHKILVLDSSTIDVAYQRRPSFISLAMTKLATNDAIYSWVTAYNTGSFKSAIIEGIGETTESNGG